MGCTTAIQAVVANKPVIEIKHRNPSGALRGFAAELTNYIVDSPKSLVQLIPQISAEQSLTMEQSKYLNSLWNPNKGTLSLVKYSKLLNSIAPTISKEDYLMLFKMIKSYGSLKISNLDISDEKWIIPSFSNILKKTQKASKILNIATPNVFKVANCLYFVSPK